MKPPEDAPFYGNPDACDTHRYWLHREFGSGKGNILFIMLNRHMRSAWVRLVTIRSTNASVSPVHGGTGTSRL